MPDVTMKEPLSSCIPTQDVLVVISTTEPTNIASTSSTTNSTVPTTKRSTSTTSSISFSSSSTPPVVVIPPTVSLPPPSTSVTTATETMSHKIQSSLPLQLVETDIIQWVRTKEINILRNSCCHPSTVPPQKPPEDRHYQNIDVESDTVPPLIPPPTTQTHHSQLFLIVTGPKGCGKRKLIQQAFVGQTPKYPNQNDTTYVCYGSFENQTTIYQHDENSSNPYCAYQGIMIDFIHQVRQRQQQQDKGNDDDDEIGADTRIVEKMRRAIRSVCSKDEIYQLLEFVPVINSILNPDSTGTSDSDQTPQNVTTAKLSTKNCDGDDHAMLQPTANNSPFHRKNYHDSNSNLHRSSDITQQQQLSHTFLKLFTAISSTLRLAPSSRIVLVFENLQYANVAAVDVLCYLLLHWHTIPNVHIIGTYVGDGLEYKESNHHHRGGDDENYRNMSSRTLSQNQFTATVTNSYLVDRIRDMERSSHGNFSLQTLPIRNLNEEQVTYVLNQIFHQCSSLMDLQIDMNNELCSVVMEETHGNTFLMTEFIHWLYDNKLLRIHNPTNCQSLSFAYWSWNIEDIHRSIANATTASVRSSDNNNTTTTNNNKAIFDIKFYIASKLEKLPTLMVDALKVGACLGSADFDVTFIEYVLNCPLQTTIRDIVNVGILLESISSDGKRYEFVHDEIKNAAYNLIPESNRELFHLEIGRRLWRRLPGHEIDHSMFVILSQLHVGRRLIHRSTERYNIATLCLHAGHKAAKSSSFRVALVYLKFAIELLGDSGWRDEYDLSLQIYNATAEMEMCNANYEGMKSLVESVVRNCRRADDTIPAKTTLLHGLLVSDQQQQGLDLGRELLSNLGFGLSKNFSSLNFWLEMKLIQRLLKGKSNDYLKRLPYITDEKVLAAMQVLNLMMLHAMLERPDMAPFIALKMMTLTLRYGLSYISPLVFGIYGILCIGAKSDRETAFRFGALALELIEALQVREYIPRVYAIYYACIHPWKHPMRESFQYLMYAHHIGLQTGDIEFSYMCASLWYLQAYEIGMPLDEIETQWAYFHNSLRSCRLQSLQNVTRPTTLYLKFNRGEDVDLCELDILFQSTAKNGQHTAQSFLLWTKAEIALLYNDLEQADNVACLAGLSSNFAKLPCSYDVVNLIFINGMIAFACLQEEYKGKRRRSRRQCFREGNAMLRSIRVYARWSPVNFVHKKLLLEAERAAVLGQSDLAVEKYICAIGTAREHHNLISLAWANEKYGRYCFSVLNLQDEAVSHFKQALLSYEQWKGQRKVDHLRADLMAMYGNEKYEKLFLKASS